MDIEIEIRCTDCKAKINDDKNVYCEACMDGLNDEIERLNDEISKLEKELEDVE